MAAVFQKLALKLLATIVALTHADFDGWLSRKAPLNDRGFHAVASIQDDAAMASFIQRYLRSIHKNVLKLGELHGLVPFYSGTIRAQDFESLKQELAAAPWVVPADPGELQRVEVPAASESTRFRGVSPIFRRSGNFLAMSSLRDADKDTTPPEDTAPADVEEDEEQPIVFEATEERFTRAGTAAATKWKQFFDQELCQKRINVEKQFRNDMYCKVMAPILYSKQLALAYMSTPRPGSRSFDDFFMSQFPDARRLDNSEFLPKGTFVFTFVSDPVSHVKGAYSTVSAALEQRPTEAQRLHTSFQNMSTTGEGGNVRFIQYLNDLDEGYFGKFASHPVQLGLAATQISGIVCTRLHRMDFIGHVENIEQDWALIQMLAHVPPSFRSRARVHPNATALEMARLRADPAYRAFDDMELSDRAVEKICDFFGSDFVCLGYDVPEPCKGGPLEPAPGDGQGLAHDAGLTAASAV